MISFLEPESRLDKLCGASSKRLDKLHMALA